MYLLQLLLMMEWLLHSEADTVTDRSGYNDSYYFRIDRAISTVTRYIDSKSYVYHIELDLYTPGNLLFSDGHSLRTTDGNTTQTVAGSATIRGYREGVGETARFSFITGFIQTNSSNVIVVDYVNHCLRVIDRLTLQTETFAGVCETSGSTNGLQGRFNQPYSVIADNKNEDNLLITDTNVTAIRCVNLTTRNVSTFFKNTSLEFLRGVTQDTHGGDLYLTSRSAVYQLTYQDKILTLLAGHPSGIGYPDGTFSDSRFNNLRELLLIDNNKKILVADSRNHRLRVLDRVSNTTESICTGSYGHADGDVDSCSLYYPYSLLVSGDAVYIGEYEVIRKLSGTTCEATYYRKSSRVCERCDCTSLSQSDQCDNTGQCPCEISDGENQELAGRQCNWYIEEVFPLHGPVAGGTKVSITGGYFSQGQLEATLDGVPLNLTVSGNSAYFISEPYPENASTQQELKVFLIAHNSTVGPEYVDFKFEYRPNPILKSIQSWKTFLSGGLSLNVTGQHMAFPQMMIVYIKQNGTTVSTATSICNVVDDTTIFCPTPDVKEATYAVLNNQSTIQEADPGMEWNGMNGLGYTLGFRYDGYDNYIDLKNHTNPKLREISVLQVFEDPVIYRFKETQVDDDVLEFDPEKDKTIRIEGTGLDWDPDQWVVKIGRERCRVTSVSANQIFCEPPLKMPEIDAAVGYREHKGKQIPHIGVRIGNIGPTVVGFVYYKSSLWEDSVAFRVCVITLPIIALITFIVILLCLLRRKRNIDNTENRSNQPLDTTMNLMPVGDSSGTVETFLGRKLDENLVATLRRCRIPKASLTLKNKIGRGNFGTVYKATQITASGSIRTVAAKTLNESKEMTAEDLETFLAEGMLMVDFNHVNVMSLIGVVFEGDDWPLVVLPYMENGDLHNFIRRDDIEIRMGDLLHFSHQIANGMDYLSKERFVHRDLAARNCMVDGTYIVKVADFGLTRNIYESNYYATDNSEKPLPIRWMAPECLIEGRYSAKSDVWSYGVIMWELLTRGGLPYPGIHNYHIKDYVVTGNRLSRPQNCPPIIYRIMSRCWSKLPDDRPDFYQISLSIEEIFNEQDSSAEEDGHDYTRCVTESIKHDYTVPKPETEVGVIDDTRISRNDDYIDILA